MTPRLDRPLITTLNGESKRRCRTQPLSSTASWAASHFQSTKPSPAWGFTVK